MVSASGDHPSPSLGDLLHVEQERGAAPPTRLDDDVGAARQDLRLAAAFAEQREQR
jgi:hypothetical protein